MSRRKSKTLTQSSYLNEDVEISVELSPQLKRTSVPQKHRPTFSDWQNCADSFSGLNPLPERGKKRKRQCNSTFQEIEKKLNKPPSAEVFDSKNDEIIWSSSDEDEDVSSKQSVQRSKSQLQEKVRRQILAASTRTAWPTELCKSLLPQNNRGKSRSSFEKKSSTDQERRWYHHEEREWLTKKPHPHFDKDINCDVQEFNDSDEDYTLKQPEVLKSNTIESFSSDEESPVVDSTPPSSLPVNEPASDLSSKSDVDISTWSSSNFSEECAGATSGGRKTSEWLQALQMVTPTKNQNDSASPSQRETSNIFDSAKKKRRHKYNKDGLALKLSRIISREKTAMNVWSYRQSELPVECKNILTACVHSFSCKFGMVIALCSLGTLSKSNVWTSRNGDSYQTVLFNHSVLELLKLQAGSVIHIYPPWQELLMPHTGEKVLLCTYYCQLVEPVPDIWDIMDNPVLDSNRRICHSFHWNCPCSTSDGSLRYCPASTCPILTKCSKIQTSVSSDVLVNKQMSKPPSSLNMVGLTTEDAATGGASTILNSIQAAPTTFQQGLCFQAMILRIFCSHNPSMQNTKKHRQNIQSWSVLVEDNQGTVCIVHISKQKPGYKNSLIQLIQSTEGETWNFFGLRVFSRSNRHKDPALFSMIDKVWICPIPQNESPKSSSESDHIVAAQVKPGFCYITGPSEDVGIENGVLPHRNSFIFDETAAQPQLLLQISTLQEIKKQDNDATRMRFTFIAKIFCLRSKLKEPQHESQSDVSANAKMVLFLSDSSVNQELSSSNYMAIHCLPSCYLPPELTANTKAPGSVLVLMRDVLLEQDVIAFADGYTRIWVWPPPANIQHQIVPSVSEEYIQQCRSLSIPLHSLQENSQCNSLFRVQGVIYSVDHKTAVTWETCPYCDEEQLAFRQDEKHNRRLVCLNCDVQVEKSVRNINLDVIIRCLSLPGHYEVRVNLLQPTVESLLPKGDHEDGYDVTVVLGQQVGPLTCLLKKQSTSQQHPVFYLEEIQTV